MKKTLALFILGFTLPAAAGSSAPLPQKGREPNDSNAREAIVRLEHEWLHVHDTQTLGRILAGDFVHVLPEGFVTRQEEIAWRAKHGWPHTDEQTKFENLRVRIYENTAIANGVVAATNSKIGTLRRTRFTDVFVNRDGRWQAVNAQEMDIK